MGAGGTKQLSVPRTIRLTVFLRSLHLLNSSSPEGDLCKPLQTLYP